MVCISTILQRLPELGICEAIVIMRNVVGEVIDINPKDGQVPGLFMWAYGRGRVRELAFDPKEWYWPREGMLKKTNFFKYTCKRGYRIIMKKQFKQLGFDYWMELSGYSFKQKRDFFSKLWHSWIPRKILSMVWVTIADGLPIGEWRRCVGLSSACSVCKQGVIQTSEHGLFGFEAVKAAWGNLQVIRSLAGRLPGIQNWEEAL